MADINRGTENGRFLGNLNIADVTLAFKRHDKHH